MNKVLIVAPSSLPVPATMGGAIETTIALLLDENEKHKKLDITVVSTYEKEAFKLSKLYKQTNFVWIRRGRIYNIINFFFRVACKVISKLDHLDSEIIKMNIRNNSYEKVIVHGNMTYLTAVSKIIDKKHILFYVHSNIFSEPTPENARIASLPFKIITVSQFISNEILKNTYIDNSKIRIVKNPVTNPFFKKKTKDEKNQTIILFVGRIVENKGIRELIKSLIMIKDNLSFKLYIIGSFGSNFGSSDRKNEFYDEIYHLCKELNDRVIFTGFVHNDDLPKYHLIADIVVMPSLCEEAAGKVAMEAMVSGLPVVTTTAGGIPEYVSTKAGILLDRDEHLVHNLSKALQRLIENPDLREKMGREGQKIAYDFRPKRYYFDYVDVISENTN
jgi:spore coat protein SA